MLDESTANESKTMQDQRLHARNLHVLERIIRIRARYTSPRNTLGLTNSTDLNGRTE